MLEFSKTSEGHMKVRMQTEKHFMSAVEESGHYLQSSTVFLLLFDPKETGKKRWEVVKAAGRTVWTASY